MYFQTLKLKNVRGENFYGKYGSCKKTILYTSLVTLFCNCSNHAFDSLSQSGLASFDHSLPDLEFPDHGLTEEDLTNPTPPSENDNSNPEERVSTPIHPTHYCDVLIDRSGLYFNFGGGSDYIAITDVNEREYNEANEIEGDCNPEIKITILKQEDMDPHPGASDLMVDQERAITIEPRGGGPLLSVCRLPMEWYFQPLILRSSFRKNKREE